MKRFITTLLLLTFILGIPSFAAAAPADITGGVNDEYKYEEYVFISGKPIKFIGDLKVSDRDRDDSRNLSYTFKLEPEDKAIKGKLDRKISYEITYDKHSDKGQTIAEYNLKSYKETITLDAEKYDLDDYQFSRSDVVDNRPASDFCSGTVKARKTYLINKNEGKVSVDISGGNVGYENFWGNTETQSLDNYIEYEKGKTKWEGTVKVLVSDSSKKTLRYQDNEASFSSFPGGHMRVTDQEMTARYDYELYTSPRERGTVELQKQMLPRIERLILPKFRDVNGHWAANDINKLYSLDVFEGNSQFFIPDAAMKRVDFARAVVKACDIRVQDTAKKKRSSRRSAPEKSPFQDVSTNNPDYTYIRDSYNKGIISGTAPGRFDPDGNLTRAQAVTILMQALGFDAKAPTPGYYLPFSDERQIPGWSRDAFYAAWEIGLVRGDSFNQVHPNKVLTRAEASAMLMRFLEFLQNDLQKDYRENIVLYQ